MIMIAPGHDNLDSRVLRSYKQMCLVDPECRLYLESSRVTDEHPGKGIVYYEDIPFSGLFFLKKKYVGSVFFGEELDDGWVYVHDSGLYGLFLIRYINRYFPNKKVIFDYHDFLDWEILHHIKKISSIRLVQKIILNFVLKFLCHSIIPALRVRALVGISSAQLNHFQRKFKFRKIPLKKVIPNTRPYLSGVFLGGVDASKNNFLWVGNVGGNRLFDKVSYYASLLESSSPHLTVNKVVVGKVWGGGVDSLDDINYLGSFRDDADILDLLSNEKYIGLFFGWDDEFDLGINCVGSPNKVYSYINLGIPFLIPSTLRDFVELYNIDDCFLYENEEDFLNKSKNIFDDYGYFCSKVRTLKDTVLWDESLNSSLLEFYKRVKS